MNKNDGKWFLTKVKQASKQFEMIQENDVLAAGVSGGKDSSVLIYILNLLQQQLPFEFTVIPVYVDLGLRMNMEPVELFCRRLGYRMDTVETRIRDIVFDTRKEKNPCSLCSKMRKGALINRAKELGCNKLALGHHLDDAVETFFLNLLYTGKLGTFPPLIYLDRMDITQVRPLIYLKERTIESVAANREIPVVNNRCEMDGRTSREDVKQLLATIEHHHPDYREKFRVAIQNVDWRGIWTEPESTGEIDGNDNKKRNCI